MDFENSWAAVFKPGQATRYFEVHGGRPFRPSVAYDATTAWWMAELSRVVYREEAGEDGAGAGANGPAPQTRDQILRGVGLREDAFFDTAGSQVALVRPAAPSPVAPDFVAAVFRGTEDLLDWFDFNFDLVPVAWPGGGKVHQGFKEAFDAVWGQVEAALPDGVPIFCTGHSLGGALATLAASRRTPVATYTFGSPRVGDPAFGASVSGTPFFRIVNNRDIVTEVPPVGLRHVGGLRYITSQGVIETDPDERAVLRDRLRRDPSFDLKRNLIDRVTGPPQALADHAPVNYVAHLERNV